MQRIYPSYQNDNLINFYTGATPTPTPTSIGPTPTPTPTPTPFAVTTSVVTNGLWLYIDGSRQSNLFTRDQSLNAFTGSTGPNPAYLNREWNLPYGVSCKFTGTSPSNPPELSFPVSSLGSNTDSWTYGGWFRGTVAGTQRLLFRGWNGGGRSYSIRISANFAGTLSTDVRLTGGTVSLSSVTSVNLDEWFYVSCVYERGVSIKLYLNGVLDNTLILSASQNVLTDVSGANQKGWSLSYFDDSPFVASLYEFNEVEIYNRALSASEVLQNYNARKIIYML